MFDDYDDYAGVCMGCENYYSQCDCDNDKE
jgi:hypothetical protein